MAKTLSGYVDNGKGAPLPNISAIVTRVTDGGIVTSGLTNADGEWLFSGLAETEEYFVNLADGNGNAIVRGPWAGEIRSAFVRDRLALPDTGLAVLPGARHTTVGGLPVALSAAGGNVLEWRADGFYTAGSVGLTQALADTLYEPIDSAWTKSEADARYAELTDVDPFPQYLTSTEADALFLTPVQGNAAYATSAHNHAAAYVDVGGDTMTGLLNLDGAATSTVVFQAKLPADTQPRFTIRADGRLDWGGGVAAAVDVPMYRVTAGDFRIGSNFSGSTNNTRDLGFTTVQWKAIFGNALYLSGDGTSAPAWASAGAIRLRNAATGDIAWRNAANTVNLTLGVTASDVLTSSAAIAAPSAAFTTSLTVATKPITPSPDAANIIEFRANGLYAAAGAVTDIWVNTTGDTMTGDLNMTANVLPTVTNVRDLGSTSLRWRKLWAVDGEFTNVPTVGGTALPTLATNDARYLNLAGGTLTGPTMFQTASSLTVLSTYITGNGFERLQVLTDGTHRWGDGASATDTTLTRLSLGVLAVNGAALLTQAAADTRYVNTTGDTMTGALSFGAMSASNMIHGTADNVYLFRSTPAGYSDIVWQRYLNDAFTIYDFTGGAGTLFAIKQVTGNTSIKGTLTVTGAATLNGLATVATSLTVGTTLSVNTRPVIMAGCRVRHNANQSIATSTLVTLAFNTEDFDTDAFHDTVTNNSRLTVPAGLGGIYHIWGMVQFEPSTDINYRQVMVKFNGGATIGMVTVGAMNGVHVDVPISITYSLTAGQYVELVVAQASGVARNAVASGTDSPLFGMQRIG